MNSATELFLAFICYSFLGWCLEVILIYIRTRKFVNRGFLFSPLCPIYGFAILSIVYVYNFFPHNVITLFFSAVILTALFELVTGFILERVFNKKWWDYSDEPLNLYGYICLWVSIAWGFLSLVTIYVIHPSITATTNSVSIPAGLFFSIILIVFIVLDLIITVVSLIYVKKRMVILNDIGDSINKLVNDINKNNAMRIQTEVDNLKKRYQNILAKKVIGNDRFAKAFPKLDLTKTAQKNRKKKK